MLVEYIHLVDGESVISKASCEDTVDHQRRGRWRIRAYTDGTIVTGVDVSHTVYLRRKIRVPMMREDEIHGDTYGEVSLQDGKAQLSVTAGRLQGKTSLGK